MKNYEKRADALKKMDAMVTDTMAAGAIMMLLLVPLAWFFGDKFVTLFMIVPIIVGAVIGIMDLFLPVKRVICFTIETVIYLFFLVIAVVCTTIKYGAVSVPAFVRESANGWYNLQKSW